MTGYRRAGEIAAEEFERGVEEALKILRERADRVGGAVNVRSAEIEVRTLLLRQYPVPQHDARTA